MTKAPSARLRPPQPRNWSANWALGYLPAFVVTVTLLAEPVGSGLLALAIFGEQPGWPELLGGAAVLAGIWAVATPPKLSAV